MRIDILTLFPEMLRGFFESSIISRACNKGYVEVNAVNIRDFSTDKHRRADDYPYGGGTGMLMTPQPIYDAYQSLKQENTHCVFLTPTGKTLTQEKAKELSQREHIVLLCGHYEGVDQRVIDLIVDEEISIGDYVLTGGELPAAVVADCVARLVPGVLPPDATALESHNGEGLEHPQYTRPPEFMGLRVPEALLNGNHAQISKWKRDMSSGRSQAARLSGKRAGIFGGTFNPIHNAHIYLALAVMAHCNLDEIIFVPTGITPHKDNNEVLHKKHRFAMTALALTQLANPRFSISSIETDKEEVCYAVDTIREFKQRLGDTHLYYIIGYDCIDDIHKWRDFETLLKLTDIIAVNRGTHNQGTLNLIEQYNNGGAHIDVLNIPPIDISSTAVRERIKQRQAIGDLVPDAVREYIQKNGLYGHRKNKTNG